MGLGTGTALLSLGAAMFVFFSNRFGCLGSILVSLALSALLYLVMRVL